MGQIWVREFTGGLDSRRMPETTAGGVLIEAVDGHITRGGEFEKRAAFVKEYELPEGTIGLAYTRLGIDVFGSDAEPQGMPLGVTYMRLPHPGESSELIDVPSFDQYGGRLYAVGVFADGSRQHYYGDVLVEDWFDGRASAAFTVSAGGAQPAVAAVGSFQITGGTLGGGNEITDIQVNSVSVIGSPVGHTGDDDTTAAAVAAEINSHTSSPDYQAYSVGPTVYIQAAVAGTAANGRAIVVTPDGDVTVDEELALAGGIDAGVSVLNSIQVNGVGIMLSPVEWAASNENTAALIVDAINSSASSPEYTAVANGAQVTILASASGDVINGAAVLFGTALGFGVTPSSGLTMSGGVNSEDTFVPGTFVLTIGSKMYSTSGPNMHFSGIQQPTRWTTEAVGAGFVDMSSESSGSEELKALARYQQYVAVFSETVIQIWYVDPDPALNRQAQVLNNTGTGSPRSVTQFGDSDVFYLNESGLRSLRARDSSNAASTADIGVPVDTLVTAKLATLTTADRDKIFGLIEPREGRFWLIIKDEIFVFSFFSGSGGTKGVSAWTMYRPGFDVEDAIVFQRRVYLRSGNSIYVYGGLGATLEYDETSARARLPYLDGDDPAKMKSFTGVDVACEGQWKIEAAMDPTNTDARDKIAIVAGTTFGVGRIGGIGQATHISMICESQGGGPAKLGSLMIHYTADGDED